MSKWEYIQSLLDIIDKQIENMRQSFQDGVVTLVNKLKSLGVTSEENSPEACGHGHSIFIN